MWRRPKESLLDSVSSLPLLVVPSSLPLLDQGQEVCNINLQYGYRGLVKGERCIVLAALLEKARKKQNGASSKQAHTQDNHRTLTVVSEDGRFLLCFFYFLVVFARLMAIFVALSLASLHIPIHTHNFHVYILLRLHPHIHAISSLPPPSRSCCCPRPS